MSEVYAFPASFAQERVWFEEKLAPGTAAYNVPGAVRLRGPLDRARLFDAFRWVTARHESLRTTLAEQDGELVQLVSAGAAPAPSLVDLTTLPAELREAELSRLVDEEGGAPFPLDGAPLFRASVLAASPSDHVVRVTLHHLVSDGGSMSVLLRDLAAAYAGEVQLPEVPIQYGDFAVWQRERAANGDREELERWKEELQGAPRPALPRRARSGSPARAERFVLDLELVSALRERARAEQATLSSLLLAACYVLLHRSLGQVDLVIGAPISGRTRVELEPVIGNFLNTLALRVQVEPAASLAGHLRRVHAVAAHAYARRDVPFDRVVRELGEAAPLDVLFIFQQAPSDVPALPGLELLPLPVEPGATKAALSFFFVDSPGQATGIVEYMSDVFEPEVVRSMIARLTLILQAYARTPAQTLAALSLQTGEERARFAAWNATERPDLAARTLESALAATAARVPQRIALEHHGVALTYRELWRRAEAEAERLRALGAGPEVLLPVRREPSIELVVEVLGILLAGAAYVPLDPEHPAARQRTIIEALGLDQPRPARRPTPPSGEALAYVMHTSGSSGAPKSVGVTRAALANVVFSVCERIELTEDDVWLALASPVFDISALELLAPLVQGARLVLTDRSIARDGHALAAQIDRVAPTVVQATPTSWRMLLDAGWRGGARLRVLSGGEALSRPVADGLLDRVAAVWNLYGPCETTIYNTALRVVRGEAPPPIGGLLANQELYVIDAAGELAAIGVPGEVYLGGIGLARGYLQQPRLTADRFVPHPWSKTPGARLYRSGDLARLRADGTLEWLGRADRKVKLRGVLIDPQEVERALEAFPSITEAAVVAGGDEPGELRLVGHYRAEAPVDARALKAHLARCLPASFLPSRLIEHAELPRTPNGKLDRAALLHRERSRPLDPPAARGRTPYGDVLAAIWSEVLSVAAVSPADDFFELGGHSLLSTRLLARVREQLGVELPLRTLFEAPTLGALAQEVERALLARQGLEPPPLPAPQDEPEGELSFGQERLWFLEQLEPGTALFTIPAAVRLRGVLDRARLRDAFRGVVARHRVLSTRYPAQQGAPRAHFTQVRFDLPELDLSALDPSGREQELQRVAAEELRLPFALAEAPVLRARLLRFDAAEHVLFLAVHHIAADGPSMDLLARELATAYAHGPLALPPLPLQHADFARSQRAWLSGQVRARLLDYWRAQLAGANRQLWPDSPGGQGRSLVGATRELRITAPVAGALRALARRERATLFMVLLAALDTLLHRHTGETDISVGTPATHRAHRELEGVIGFFVNTLVLRADLDGDPTFRQLLARVRETCLSAYEHQHLPYELLVAELQPARRIAPLFQVLLILHAPVAPLHTPGLELQPIPLDTKTAHFDLTLTVIDGPAELTGTLEYDVGLFEARTIEHMLAAFGALLESIARDADRPIGALSLGAGGVPATPAAEADARPVHRLFEEQALRTPDRLAVIAEGGGLTYRQLDQRANAVAHHLAARLPEGREARVGILAQRTPDLLALILGTLKAGAAYVPIDPALPAERVGWMLRDAGVELLLERGEALAAAAPPARVDHPARAAYVIYTSGSTGRPAGVLVEHRSLSAFAQATRAAFGVGPDDRVLQFASLSWDTSAEEIYPALICGATVALRSERMVESAAAFLAGCEALEVSIADLPTAFWHELTRYLESGALALPRRLKTVVIGGERALPDRVALWHRLVGPHVRLVNSYGATEATAITTTIALQPEARPRPWVPIGRAVAGARVYVLDGALAPVPEEIAGELYIGGSGVARGYLARPDRTAERFLPDPYSPVPGARMYRTGDRVRRLAGGVLEYLGRGDAQVKVRGHRVELGEIEAVFSRHDGVREVAAVASEDGSGERRILLFVAGAPLLNAQALRRWGRASLPEHMLPESIVLTEALPRNASGKLDRRALARRAPAAEPLDPARARPRTPDEQLLHELWCDVLERRQLGIHDDFFEHGGHSLRATRLIARLRDVFRLELPLRDVFEAPTIALLAERVAAARRRGQAAAAPIPRVDRAGVHPVSFAQRRLWFLDRLAGPSAAYNMPAAVHIRGPLDLPLLLGAIQALVVRHEALRTRFGERDGEPTQEICAEVDVVVPLLDLAGAPREEVWRVAGDLAREPFDLARELPIRFYVVRLSDGEWGLAVVAHHISCDAWSLAVLARELDALYHGTALPPLPIQYLDYAAWQRRAPGEEGLAWWSARLAGVTPLLLQPDRPRRPLGGFEGAAHVLHLGGELSERVRALSRREGVSLFMTFLAAFQVLLHRYTGQEDIAVGSPVANRGRTELEGLIGFFVNMVVLRLDLSGRPSFRALLARVREVCLDANDRHEVAFEQIVERVRPARDLGKNPLFQVGFALNDATETPARLFGQPMAPVALDTGTSKFDLSLAVLDTKEGFLCTFEHNAALFQGGTVARMAEHFRALVAGCVNDPAASIAEVPLQQDGSAAISAGEVTGDAGRCVHELIDAGCAVRSADGVIDGAELARRAGALAGELSARGVGPEGCVGVQIERSLDLIVALAAIAKAGAAYLPLDPALPVERREALLRDARPQMVLRSATCPADQPGERRAPGAPVPANLFCVMYTSGTTGAPKGVLTEHGPVVNRLRWMQRALGVTREDRVLAKTSIGFDVSIWEMFLPLVSGACLVLLAPGVERDVRGIAEAVMTERITLLHFVPSALAAFLEVADGGRCPSLRAVVCSGETLPTPLAERFHARFPRAELHNLYGPTEAAIDVTAAHVARGAPVSIGTAIDNVRVYVLEPTLALAPVGVRGELYLGGVAPARGYRGRPALTAERFLPDPYAERPGARMYRTGDVARRLADGTIEHLGRVDRQVKIRGVRIEPQEVELALLEDPRVAAAVVVPRAHTGGPRLVAYVVARAGATWRPRELASRLKRRLPEHAVPAFFVPLSRLPLTTNGKVDVRALPAEGAEHAARGAYEPPRTELERELAAMWCALLGLEQVGVHDSFFELGGHSLLLTQLAARLTASFGVELSLAQLFEEPTILAMTQLLACELARQAGEAELTSLLDEVAELSAEELAQATPGEAEPR